MTARTHPEKRSKMPQDDLGGIRVAPPHPSLNGSHRGSMAAILVEGYNPVFGFRAGFGVGRWV
jgi:hypothetical protein